MNILSFWNQVPTGAFTAFLMLLAFPRAWWKPHQVLKASNLRPISVMVNSLSSYLYERVD